MANYGKPGMGTWARVLDTNALERRQGDAFKQESYWPIGASQEIFSCIIVKVCCVLLDSDPVVSDILSSSLQGTASHPGFPRPFPSDLPIRIPFRGSRGEDPKKPTDTMYEEQ